MVTPAPAKTKSDVELLVERFIQAADERIIDCSVPIIPTLSDSFRRSLLARIDEEDWAKRTIRRLAKVIDES